MKQIMFSFKCYKCIFLMNLCIIVYAVCVVNNVLSLDILMKNKVPRKRIKRKKIVGAQNIMCTQRTSRARSMKSLTAGVQGPL